MTSSRGRFPRLLTGFQALRCRSLRRCRISSPGSGRILVKFQDFGPKVPQTPLSRTFNSASALSRHKPASGERVVGRGASVNRAFRHTQSPSFLCCNYRTPMAAWQAARKYPRLNPDFTGDPCPSTRCRQGEFRDFKPSS